MPNSKQSAVINTTSNNVHTPETKYSPTDMSSVQPKDLPPKSTPVKSVSCSKNQQPVNNSINKRQEASVSPNRPVSQSQVHFENKEKERRPASRSRNVQEDRRNSRTRDKSNSFENDEKDKKLSKEMGGMKIERKDSAKGNGAKMEHQQSLRKDSKEKEIMDLPKMKEYPDSEDEEDSDDRKTKTLLQYGTISSWQAGQLEKFYQDYHRFPSAEAVKKFIAQFKLSAMDVEIWLETRREMTYRKFVKRGMQTEPSIIKFYCEALKMAEGVRLEQPSIRAKSFFSHEGINEIEAKKELEEKEQPSISVSSNKLFVTPKKEEKAQIVIKNNGEVNVVYQISMMNSEKYIMSPICAILSPNEELTLNICRKPGPVDDEEFFRIDYGHNPEGVIDARIAADRGQLVYREIIQVVAIDESEMKVVR